MNIKRILVTGNLGYIGPVLVARLQAKGYFVRGLDNGLYANTSIGVMKQPDEQIIKDVRDISDQDLDSIDAIIHLAGLSNDPLGEFSPDLTHQINYVATVALAERAKKLGIGRFVFASSQSIYGKAPNNTVVKESDTDFISPLTAYAESKWLVEQHLSKMADSTFCPVFFRPSTVFGYAPNLRVDIVYNSFIGCAMTTQKIEIKSDGTPWRPIIHVWDVCTAFILGVESSTEFVFNQAFNVGVLDGNYTVKQIAEAAQQVFPQTDIVFTNEHSADQRSYKVSFDKIYQVFGEQFRPVFDLQTGGIEMFMALTEKQFSESDFRGAACNRLAALKGLVTSGKANPDLRVGV